MDEFQELINEFLIESNENLSRLDQEFVELEQRPEDRDLLGSVFRTIHTIKGTCGFLAFGTLEAITHRAENILSQLRDGERRLSPAITTLLLQTVDAVKQILGEIEETGGEGSEDYAELREALQAASDGQEPGELPAAGPAAADSVSAPEADETGEPAESVLAGSEAAGNESGDEDHPPTGAAAEETVAETKAVPAEPAGGSNAQARPRQSKVAGSNIRVDVSLLDKLMNLVGALVLARNQILQHATTKEDAALAVTSQRLNLITTELQANVMKTRMQPIGVVWNKFPRVVRDLGQASGKQIDVKMEGAKTELDKTIIEAIKDPLTHIVRNCCDHGVESSEERIAAGKAPRGTVSLRAFHEGGQVNIEISDDGAGIDTERLKTKAVQNGLITAEQAERMSERELLNLALLPGLSTAEKVTNVSGRGVGMDVVRTNIEKIGGSIDIQSWKGRGTTIKIKIPLTLAIIPALIVNCAGERFAIPQVSLAELLRLDTASDRQQIEWIHGAPVYRLRGKLLPLVYLNSILQLEDEATGGDTGIINIIVLQADEKTFGLVVDSINDTAEIVVKPLDKLLKGLNCYAGATIMGDGKVALILDVMGVAQMGHVVGESRHEAKAHHEEQTDSIGERQTVLLFRSGRAERLAVPLALVYRLEEFPRSDIEQSGDRQVVQYRGRILPLVSLAGLLGLEVAENSAPADPVQVVVFSDGPKRIGVIVDEIMDIIDEAITVRVRAGRAGILGSAVISGRVTDFIDLRYLIDAVDKDWFSQRHEGPSAGRRVLIAEASPFSRGLIKNFLEMAGHQVTEAGDHQTVLQALRNVQVDVLLSSLDLPGGDAFDLLKQIRTSPDWSHLPVLALANSLEESSSDAGRDYHFDAYHLKLDREAMLTSIEKLAVAVTAGEAVLQES